METIPFHPIAEIMPMMDEAAFKRHVKSVKEHGQREPIVLLEGKILDGRNTYMACLEIDEVPIFRDWGSAPTDGESPTAFVVTRNIVRRHLTTSQAAASAAAAIPFFQAEAAARKEKTKLAGKTAEGKPKRKDDDFLEGEESASVDESSVSPNLGSPKTDKGKASEKAAESFGVSKTSVETAAKLQKEHPEKFQQVAAGEESLNQAAQEAATEPPKDDPTKHLRKAHAAELIEQFGEEFGKAFKRGSVLKTVQEIEHFLTLDKPDRKQVYELVLAGWPVKKAKKFMDGDLDRTNKINDAIVKLNATGKDKLALDIEGIWELTIKRKKTV